MTVLRICGAGERGDLEFNNHNKDVTYNEEKEEGKRSYSFAQNVYNYCMEFCSVGTIHGIRYFAEHRTYIEKLWWAISIILSLYFCISLVRATYIKWDTSPVIVSFATKETPVWMLPFPAVTICPESKTRMSAYNYTYYLHKKQDKQVLSDDEERKFGYMSFVCNTQLDLDYKSGKYADERMFNFLEEVQPDFYEGSFDCRYLGKSYNCSELFIPIITDDGICYTFNIMDRSQILSNIVKHYKNYHKTKVSKDWSIENGYDPSAPIYAYPRRALYAGIPNALEIKFKVHEDDLDYTCGTAIKGFKVQIAHPQRLPRVKEQHFVVPLDRVAKAAVAPDMMTTSNDIRNYKPERRNCFFPSEKALKYFSVYTQNNCAIECRANFTLSQCGCVPFYVPRDEGTPICGAESHKCLKNAVQLYQKNKLRRAGLKGVFNKEESSDLKKHHTISCRCLPICTSMYYNIQNNQANWNWRTMYKHHRNKDINIDDKKIKMSMLQVFFKGNQFINSERNELYGFTDFLANVGGLLGLFIGFSALSLGEIVYYLTLRIICNIAMFGKRNWSGKIYD